MKNYSIHSNTKLAFDLAFEDLLEKSSYERITVDDIASRCCAHRTTFYYHFKDKADLVYWYFDYMMTVCMKKRVRSDDFMQFVTNWSDSLLMMFQIMKEKKAFFSAVAKYTGQNSFADCLYEWNVNAWDKCVLACHGLNKLPAELQYARAFHYSGFSGLVMKWIQQGMKEEPEQMVSIVVDNMSPLMRKYLP